ncbi:GGDEF domain-containing protein [Clostridium novyi]|uniref:Diguanylate cyclase/phosphodiesterase domain 2 n=2 Tax=Clostridium TaxID=1485 RepID=A0Q1G3_CLONN|nr:GGDEF domain-containing protein [Clostridium novyi]ABK60669.1 Diguanylate cyclase/phosphodiesterase domain 2 [Clostridium novyi NT]KEH88191.1 hypothetical protein Z966_06320 [Clostridium novyi A str. NCTC 538]KEH89396.1 hypothetical protein Z967_09450 [Clostridium novyi A str. 4540]KEH91316.1 hypothetical protein Z965_00205 [Clostridium novyi A str. BKT29909]
MNYENMTKEELIEILRYKESVLNKLYLEKEKLKYYANTDVMTGVLNRRAGLKLLNKEFDLSKISNENIVICFADVDKLKMINDTFGHKEGDKVLKFVAKTLRDSIRKDDFIIRMGGDEFLIVFPRTSIKDVGKICNRIDEILEEINKNSCDYNLNLSYGFYEYNSKVDNKMTLSDLIKSADMEMYKKKREKT